MMPSDCNCADDFTCHEHREKFTLGAFKAIPKRQLDRMIAKGRKDAKELNDNIKSQFQMTAADASMRLD